VTLNNNADLKGKDEDLWFEIYKFQFEDYQYILDLVKLIHLIPSNSACCEREMDFALTLVISFFFDFWLKNIIKPSIEIVPKLRQLINY